jgi:hypothetical protein
LLVSIGLISLVPATLQYRQNIRIRGEEYQGRPRSLAVIVAVLIFNSRRPRIDCDDFSPMIPEQFRKLLSTRTPSQFRTT